VNTAKRKRTAVKKESMGSRLAREIHELADDLEAGRSLTRHRVRFMLSAAAYSPDELRAFREKARVSQSLLAEFLGVSLKAVQAWEGGRRKVPRSSRRFLDEIGIQLRADPDYLVRRIGAAAPA